MTLNAIDGMFARESGMKSSLGSTLNELGDVVSDAALYLPFALIPDLPSVGIVAIVLLATISGFAGVFGMPFEPRGDIAIAVACLLLVITIINRAQKALPEISPKP